MATVLRRESVKVRPTGHRMNGRAGARAIEH